MIHVRLIMSVYLDIYLDTFRLWSILKRMAIESKKDGPKTVNWKVLENSSTSHFETVVHFLLKMTIVPAHDPWTLILLGPSTSTHDRLIYSWRDNETVKRGFLEIPYRWRNVSRKNNLIINWSLDENGRITLVLTTCFAPYRWYEII